MADWAVISSLATAGGTLVLAGATFASVRSANRSAKVSERALLATNLPLLVPSHISDPPEKIRFLDDRWIKVKGGHGYAEATDSTIYLAIALRNAGRGLALLDRWSFAAEERVNDDPDDPQTFRRLTRDIYVTPGDTGFWQGAVRDANDPQFADVRAAITERHQIILDIEYADQEGGQRTVSRIALTPFGEDEWLASSARHWRLDGVNPR